MCRTNDTQSAVKASPMLVLRVVWINNSNLSRSSRQCWNIFFREIKDENSLHLIPLRRRNLVPSSV